MKICPKCSMRMKPVRQMGSSSVYWICINTLCEKPDKKCSGCGRQVQPESLGLNGIRYTCQCGKTWKD